jgi:hypothetical protein
MHLKTISEVCLLASLAIVGYSPTPSPMQHEVKVIHPKYAYALAKKIVSYFERPQNVRFAAKI